MPTVYRLNYCPDLDTNWSINPGACTDMEGLAPLANGNLTTFGDDAGHGFSTTGSDVLHAEMFTKTDGTVRLLAFRAGDIDEYASDATRTNRGTGYTTASDWDAAAWGNQIIAVSKANATQSSTGAGFTALGGSSPKAARIAANANFVMMADVDDGGSNVYADMVWWCGIRNPATWTPAQATQAGNVRLLDEPGPIVAIAAFGDKFLAFKENAIFLGQYIGPPYVFSWRVISNVVGLSYPKALTICDGKMYFVHRTGFFAFDGQQVSNVGQGVNSIPASKGGGGGLVPMRAASSEIEGIVWFCGYFVVSGTSYYMNVLALNARTGLWARMGRTILSGDVQCPVVCTQAQLAAFREPTDSLSDVDPVADLTYFDNSSSPAYKVATISRDTPEVADVRAPTVTTGLIGTPERAGKMVRVYPRVVRGDPSDGTSTAYMRPLQTEYGSVSSSLMSYNTELGTYDAVSDARYHSIQINWTTAANFEMAGLGVDRVETGKR